MPEVALSTHGGANAGRFFVPVQRLVFVTLAAILGMDAAEAYAIGGMPLPWIGMACAVPLILLQSMLSRLRAPPATGLYLVVLLWLYVNTLISSLDGGFADMMPPMATTSYPVFVFLRAYSFLGFLLLTTIVYNHALKGGSLQLLDYLVWLGILVTIYAFYILAAQRLGLPMPPKNRYGTGEAGAIAGGETGTFGDSTERYLFRTIGSFREPSFLGIWLIVPFFASLATSARPHNWRTVVLGLGVLSTGSLTALVAIIVGAVAALQIVHPLSRRSLGIILAVTAAGGVLVLVLNLVVGIYFGGTDGFSFIDQYWPRIERILSGGITQSNRGYAFQKFFDSEFSLWGKGLGNAHLEFSVLVPISFLSLYFHTWFAAGAVGLSLLVLYLAMPLVLLALRFECRRPNTIWLVAPYIAWLTVFTVNEESFSIMFSVATGLMLAHFMEKRSPAVQ